ncbi:MAG: ATP-binding protein [Planctomycetales bacterium]|nr:ATP-binding protein [Planctomycetales bacterium]
MSAKVLVVDDSPMDRRAVAALLEAMPGVTVDFATNVDEAQTLLAANPPQVVVTDLIMPERNGLDLVTMLVNEYPLIPVILMTGRGSEETAVQALQAGAASYVPKALLTQRLVETVQHVLAVAHEERSHMRLMGSMTRSHSEFTLENDPAMIPPLINFLHRSIRTVGLCDESEGIRVCVALEEAVNNALFHGNLELDSETREHDPVAYRDLLESRRTADPYASRRVYIEARLTRERGVFVVRDEGPGFDPATLPNPTEPQQIERASGRGLLLIRTFMDAVHYNETGNVVTLEKHGPATKREQA